MATNLALDDTLIEEAKKIGKHRTKKALSPKRCMSISNVESNLKFSIFSIQSFLIKIMITNSNEL
jgi:hypothetical protein